MQFKPRHGFPGGLVVKNLPANAGDTWSRKIPHAAEQLSLCVTTTEARAPIAPFPATREATTTRSLHTTMKNNPPPNN